MAVIKSAVLAPEPKLVRSLLIFINQLIVGNEWRAFQLGVECNFVFYLELHN